MHRNIVILFFFISAGLAAQTAGKPVYTRKVYFEFNKYDLRPEDNKTYVAFLRAVKAQENYTVKLTGHTDDVDSDPYNNKLGLNRAKAVKEYLVSKGVPAESIQVATKGEKAAEKDNKSDTGRALNRRVEMELYGKGTGAGSGTGTGPAEGAIWLGGVLYDYDTKEKITGDITVSIQNHREVDRDKIKQHKQTDNYGQNVIKDRTYTVYVNAEGYRAESYTVTIPADAKPGSIVQDAYLHKLNIKMRFNYEKIYFVPNKDEFQPTAHDELQELLQFMEGDTSIHIEIRGHINYTKNRPPMTPFEEYLFYDLSLRRAIAVYNYLSKFGVSKKRMSYRGMSNREMILPYAQTLEDCQRNMRVEILVLK